MDLHGYQPGQMKTEDQMASHLVRDDRTPTLLQIQPSTHLQNQNLWGEAILNCLGLPRIDQDSIVPTW